MLSPEAGVLFISLFLLSTYDIDVVKKSCIADLSILCVSYKLRQSSLTHTNTLLLHPTSPFFLPSLTSFFFSPSPLAPSLGPSWAGETRGAIMSFFKRRLQTAQTAVDLSCQALQRVLALDIPVAGKVIANSVTLPGFEAHYQEHRVTPWSTCQTWQPAVSHTASCPAWLHLSYLI